jgi:hypothetical protein
MAKLPGKRSKTRRTNRFVKAQREYVEKKLSKRQASYFRKLTPSKQRTYAEQKLTKRQLAKLPRERGSRPVRRPLRDLPEARIDSYGRARLSLEQRDILRKEIRRLREKGDRPSMRKIQFLREQARQGRMIRARAVPGYKQWRTIMRGLASKDNSARGAKAKALVLLGLRDPDWDWDVGDTPEGVHMFSGRKAA